MKKNFLFKGVSALGAMLLLATSVMPGLQYAVAIDAINTNDETYAYDFIYDEASWNTAYHRKNSAFKKYLDANPSEYLWCGDETDGHAATEADAGDGSYPGCSQCWLGAKEAFEANPWMFLDFPDSVYLAKLELNYDNGGVFRPLEDPAPEYWFYLHAIIPLKAGGVNIKSAMEAANLEYPTDFNVGKLVVTMTPHDGETVTVERVTESCESGKHLELGECVSNTKQVLCEVTNPDVNGIYTKEGTWNSKLNTYVPGNGECTLTSCEEGYHGYNGQCVANPVSATIVWDYINDAASWNNAYHKAGSVYKKYEDSAQNEDRWCRNESEPNGGHWGTCTDINGEWSDAENKCIGELTAWPDNCVKSWKGASNAAGAQYPWIVLNLPEDFSWGIVSFSYNGGAEIYPWGNSPVWFDYQYVNIPVKVMMTNAGQEYPESFDKSKFVVTVTPYAINAESPSLPGEVENSVTASIVTATQCEGDTHLELGECVSNTKQVSCTPAGDPDVNANYTTAGTWTPELNTYIAGNGECTLTSCKAGYHLDNNQCVVNTDSEITWDYVYDNDSWNNAYHKSANSSLKTYQDNNPDEDRWNINAGRWAWGTDKVGGEWPNYCVKSWKGAINADGANYPWVVLNIPSSIQGTVSFYYDGEYVNDPWGTNKSFTNTYGIASIPTELENVYDSASFDVNKLFITITPTSTNIPENINMVATYQNCGENKHLELGVCEDNVKENQVCTPENPDANANYTTTKTWNKELNMYEEGTCAITSCKSGYTKSGNKCVRQSTSSGGGGGSSSYSCKNLPDNATANNSTKPTKNTDYSYSTDTTKVCTFQCKSGYAWNEKTTKCEKSDASDTTKTEENKTDGNANTNEGSNNDGSNGNGATASSEEFSQEFIDAYNFAFKNGITTKESIEDADMYGPLTRIAMAKMLSQYAINVLGQTPDTSKVVPNFPDVDAQLDADYNNGVTLAYQLGIMGIGIQEFRPFAEVTRAEFGTALSRMLFGTADGEGAEWYKTHLDKLMNEQIITNDNPNLKELRGYVMIMLMRSAQ